MTIKPGYYYVVESLDQFRRRLDVSWHEIATAFGEPLITQCIEHENQILDECDALISAERQIQDFDTDDIILTVLTAREREYVHVYDAPVHRIVELHPDTEA